MTNITVHGGDKDDRNNLPPQVQTAMMVLDYGRQRQTPGNGIFGQTYDPTPLTGKEVAMADAACDVLIYYLRGELAFQGPELTEHRRPDDDPPMVPVDEPSPEPAN